jgi:hypothetical protein
MNRTALLILVLPLVAVANSEYCLVDYQDDFAFSENRYVTDLASGFRAEVGRGPHGFVGEILLPKADGQERAPVERFETFYRSLNCQWNSIDTIWKEFTETFAERRDCSALAFGKGRATFQCRRLLESFWVDEDALGPFLKYESRATGPWYQSAEYAAAKKELDRLGTQALRDAHTAIVDAVSSPKCLGDVNPEVIGLPENDLPANRLRGVDGSISFTVGTDGTVSEILLGQKADYGSEYVMAWAARRHGFPEQDKRCRATWNHVLD